VEVNTDNSDGKLLPYLTANVHFLTGERHNVLMVQNSALRWSPSSDLIAPAYRQVDGSSSDVAAAGIGTSGAGAGRGADAEASDAGGGGGGGGGGGRRRGGRRGGDAGPRQTGTLWAQEDAFVRPIPVNLGLTDGTWTEVQGEGLTNGMTLVVGIQTPDVAADDSGGASPFIPQIGRRGGPGGGGGAGGGGPGGPGGGGGRRSAGQ
jgi:HlyD family secretion protein